MTRDVFISHAGDDASVAVEVCALLEARGLKCWMAPRDVAAGSVWDEAILDAIEQSHVFLLILSSHANKSQFVKNEVNRAFSQGKPIVTFRLEDVPPGRSLELYLARHHWTDAFPPPLEARVENLSNSVRALLDTSVAPAVRSSAASAAIAAPARTTNFVGRLRSGTQKLVKSTRSFAQNTLIFGIGCLLLGGLVASIATWHLKGDPEPFRRPVTRAVIHLPAGQQLAGLSDGPALAISPDGTMLAYVAQQGGVRQLYLRAMDNTDAKPVPGTDDASDPFFSPDGQWLGFFSNRKLMKVSLNGGAAIPLAMAAFDGGAAWSRLGTVAFTPSNFSVVQGVSESGGVVRPLTALDGAQITHRWPDYFPDGKSLLFVGGTSGAIFTNARTGVRPAGTLKTKYILQGGVFPRYALSGHLVYAQASVLMAVPFDAQKFEVTGPAVPMAEGVMQSATAGFAQYSFSKTGSLVYVPGGNQAERLRLVWVNRTGAEEPLNAPVNAYLNPRVSPDGQRLAVGLNGEEGQIWQYNFSRQTLTRMTFEGSVNNYPAWTPDGMRIAFVSNKEGPLHIFWQLADGSGGLERLGASDNQNSDISGQAGAPSGWSPDGNYVAFNVITPSGIDVILFSVNDRKLQEILKGPFNQSAATFSPDGRWLMYVSDESGRYEVYVMAFPGPGGKWQISNDGGTEPVWNPNDREIFYRSGDKMMAVDIAAQPGFSVGKPHLLFTGPYAPTPITFPNYDVSRDGQRFLMLKPVDQTEAPATQINVIANWFEELKQKVPAGKN